MPHEGVWLFFMHIQPYLIVSIVCTVGRIDTELSRHREVNRVTGIIVECILVRILLLQSLQGKDTGVLCAYSTYHFPEVHSCRQRVYIANLMLQLVDGQLILAAVYCGSRVFAIGFLLYRIAVVIQVCLVEGSQRE